MSGDAIARMVRRLGTEAGLGNVRPHQLRHAAIPALLDETSGDVRRVRLFSRHRDLATVATYDDLRADVGGELAELLSRKIDIGR